ncbi:MAG: YbhB/YbcL family Raf kinase inhibitor-like protein [Ilumatobacteraceae bacterium]
MTERPCAPLPYDFLPEVPVLEVASNDIAHGQPLPAAHASGMFGVEGGQDKSPHLRWRGAPESTRSYAVTCFDPDAPTGSGFWHWTVFDIPASVTELAAGAGAADGSGLPAGAGQARNDANVAGYIGAGPPPGHGPHRYAFAVHALDVDNCGATADSTPAFVGFTFFGHTVARGLLVATFER